MQPDPPPMFLPNDQPELFTIDEAVMQMFEMDERAVFWEMKGEDAYPRFYGIHADVEEDIYSCIQFDKECKCIRLCDQYSWPDYFGNQESWKAKFPKAAFYEVWLRRSRYRIPLPKWLQECHDPYAFAEPDPQPEGGQMSVEEEGSAGYWSGLLEEALFQTECVRWGFIGKDARRKGTARGGRPKGDPHRWLDAAKRCLPQLMQRPERCRTRQLLYELMADLTRCSAEHCKRQLCRAEKEEGRRIDVKKGGMGQKPQG